MSTATLNPAAPPPVKIMGDEWQPQILAAVFVKGQIAIHTLAAGHLVYSWPTNEFQAVAPAEGQRLWCVFDPIIPEEIWAFAEPAGKDDLIFLGVAEVVSPEPQFCEVDHTAALAAGWASCPDCLETLAIEEVAP